MRKVLKFIPLLATTIIILLYFYDKFMADLICLFFFFIVLPVIGASIVLFIKSFSFANTSWKVYFAWGLVDVLLVVGYNIFVAPDTVCNPDIMAEHYEKNALKMKELIQYTNQALDDSAAIQLEFEHGDISIFHVSSKRDSLWSSHWNEDAEDKKDSLRAVVGLTSDELEEIEDRLDELGCIGISTKKDRASCVIYFRRVVMGMYSYILFDEPMDEKEKEYYMGDPAYIPYSETVVFEYGGGAIGLQVFPSNQRDSFLSVHKPW